MAARNGVMSKQRLLVHIGVPKSATTTLQFEVFPNHPDIRYLGKPFYDEKFGYEGSLATAELVDSLWKQDELEFDYALAQERFQNGIYPRLIGGKVAVLSEEGISQASAADRTLTACRIRGLCRDIECSILITIREQKNALFSGHQWIYTRRLTSLRFDEWIRFCRSYSSYYGCYNDFPLRQYRYARLVETYIKLFGRERVLVLPMEMLARERNLFLSRLEDFLQIKKHWSNNNNFIITPENRSPGKLGIRYQRAVKGIKHLYKCLLDSPVEPSEALEETGIHGIIMRYLEHIDSPMPPMSLETASWLDEYYQTDNAVLNKLIGLDLRRYGYVC
jgi:hypothetical protein